MRKIARRALVAAVVAAVAAGCVTGARAYFSSSGGGSAAASAASAAPLTIAPATPAHALSPGASADVAVEIDNPNPFRVRVGSLVLDTGRDGGFGVDAAHASAGCTADAAALTYAAQSVDRFVPAKVGDTDGSLTLDLPAAVSMGAGAADACQGAAFHVYLAVAP